MAGIGTGLWHLLTGDDDDENKTGLAGHRKGVVDVKKDHLAMIHEGEVVLDNKAALDFKEGAKVLGGIASHEKGLAGPLDDKEGWLTPEKDWWKSQYQKETEGLEWWNKKVARKGWSKSSAESEWMFRVDRYGLEDARKTNKQLRAESDNYLKSQEWPGTHKTAMETLEHIQKNFGVELMKSVDMMGQTAEDLTKQGYIGAMMVPTKFGRAFHELGLLDWKNSDKESKWAKGLEELGTMFTTIDSELAFYRLMGVKHAGYDNPDMQIMAASNRGEKYKGERWKGTWASPKGEQFAEALYALGLDWGKYSPQQGVKRVMEGMGLDQMFDLKFALEKYLRIRESLHIAQGRMLPKEAIWGGNVTGLGPDKDVITTNFGKNYSTWNEIHAKGTGLGMVKPLKYLLVEAAAEVQNLVGGSAFYKSTDKSVYDARHRLDNIPRAQYGIGVAGSGLIFADKGEEVLEKAEVATIAQALAGNQLNNAAYNRVGLGGPAGMGSAPTVVNAPTTVNNATVMPARATSARHLGKVSGEDMDRLVS